MRYSCEMCGHVYDEEQGDPRHGIQPGTPIGELSGYSGCPVCGADWTSFCQPEKNGGTSKENMKQLCGSYKKYHEDHLESDR